MCDEYSLESLSEAVHYNAFVYSLMRPYLGESVLELGAGIGNQTPFLLEDGRHVLAIDIDERLVNVHRQRVMARPNLRTASVSIQHLAEDLRLANTFDSVVSSNVLEHIPDGLDREVVAAMRGLLKKGGHSIHWVPACESIYGSLDESFKHVRRYTKASAEALFVRAGFEIVSCEFWNMLGFVGWWFSGRVLRIRRISKASALIFDRFVMPMVSAIEPLIPRPFGQSLLIVGKKQ
jgi:SAM-dependent methyltransferase